MSLSLKKQVKPASKKRVITSCDDDSRDLTLPKKKKPIAKDFILDEAEVVNAPLSPCCSEPIYSADNESTSKRVSPRRRIDAASNESEAPVASDEDDVSVPCESEVSSISVLEGEDPVSPTESGEEESVHGKDGKVREKKANVRRRYRKCPVPGCVSKLQQRLPNHLSKAHPSLTREE